jgi:hypothetical protein
MRYLGSSYALNGQNTDTKESCLPLASIGWCAGQHSYLISH